MLQFPAMEALSKTSPIEAGVEIDESEALPYSGPVYIIDNSWDNFMTAASLRTLGAEVNKDIEPEIKDHVEDYITRSRLIKVIPGQERERIRHEIFRHQNTGRLEIPEGINSPDWANLKDYYHPNGASLVTCAREFKAMNPQFADYWNAMGSCDVVSFKFARLLRERGVTGAKVHTKLIQSSDDRHETVFMHVDVRIGRLVIDWTYRQYKKDAPFPYVYVNKNQEPELGETEHYSDDEYSGSTTYLKDD